MDLPPLVGPDDQQVVAGGDVDQQPGRRHGDVQPFESGREPFQNRNSVLEPGVFDRFLGQGPAADGEVEAVEGVLLHGPPGDGQMGDGRRVEGPGEHATDGHSI